MIKKSTVNHFGYRFTGGFTPLQNGLLKKFINMFSTHDRQKASLSSFRFSTGFTLIELLVVIAILGILSAIGLSSFQGASRSARDGKRKGDINQVRAALELYKSDGTTPDAGKYPNTTSYGTMTSRISNSGYLSAPLPVDPKNVNPYVYSYSSGGTTYCICANLENGGGNSTGNCSATPGNFYCLTQP